MAKGQGCVSQRLYESGAQAKRVQDRLWQEHKTCVCVGKQGGHEQACTCVSKLSKQASKQAIMQHDIAFTCLPLNSLPATGHAIVRAASL